VASNEGIILAYGKVDLGNLIVEDQDLAEGTLIIGTGPWLWG
jgi:hypothetical protein